MAQYSRRQFLQATGGMVTAAALPLGCENVQCPCSNKWAGFQYAMCNESMRELSWAQQCKIISDAGYTGVEIAAFTLVKQGVQDISPAQRKEMCKTMKDNGIECVGLHWLLAPPPKGLHFTTPDAALRQKTIDYLNALIDFSGDLDGPYMIFGSPKQRNTLGISKTEAQKHFADGLAKVADHAQKRNVKILIEHLGSEQTDVVNTLAEAMEVARMVNHPAIQIMFDFHNTPDETEPFDVLIKRYYKHIYHVHVQEMDGKHLGKGNAVNDYVKSFQLLKDLKYDKWVSLEVFDFTPGGKVIAEESIKVLKEIEAKLT
jgi:D-psicose/D-tagatose/L-ribulose 3-epimerase